MGRPPVRRVRPTTSSPTPDRMSRRSLLLTFCLVLAVAVLAGLEFLHEYRHGDAPDAALCLTPESRKEAIREVLMHHMRGH